LARVCVDQLPNAASEDGANKDVRVENDHLSGMSASATQLCELGDYFFFIDIGQRTGEPVAAAFSSEISAVLGRLRGVGT